MHTMACAEWVWSRSDCDNMQQDFTALRAGCAAAQSAVLQFLARRHVQSVGHPPNNTEFRALMLAATEAAMHDSTAGKRVPLAAGDLPRGVSAAADAPVTADGGPGAVLGLSASLAPVDLHGLSSAEARAAVLSTLSQLQVCYCTPALLRCNMHSRECGSNAMVMC